MSATHLALRPYQRETIDAVRSAWKGGKNRVAIILPTGCHRAGQHVLMFDGRTKAVEDVQVGDLLMGPDSTPRAVLALARGTGPMLEIQPTKGEPWVVNDEHVLTLVRTTHKAAGTYPSWRGGEICDVPLPKWQGWAAWRKHVHKLFRVGVRFPPREAPPLDPYFLGVVLGDGSLSVPSRLSVATVDPEIAQLCHETAAHYGLKVRIDGRNGIQHNIAGARSRNGPRGGSNPILTALRGLGLLPIACEDRFVPGCYRLGSRQVRLETLAGLLDSDGALSRGGFDYGSKSERLARDVAFLARSLGLAAYVTKRPIGHYRVSISGDCSVIPTRIPRKRAPARVQKKDHLRTGFTVTPTGTVEPYYGFTLDGDQRYLLDDFTVTHNSGKTVVTSHLIGEEIAPGERALFLAHREELVDQAAEKMRAIIPGARVGIEMANRKADLSCEVVVASVPTLASARRIVKWPCDAFRKVIVDECHHALSDTYVKVMDYFGCYAPNGTDTLGVTATLARGDGAGLGTVWQEVAYERSVLEMIVDAYLVNPRGRRVEVDIDFSQVRTKGGDYVASELGEALTEAGFEQVITEAYLRHGGGRPGLVFTPTVATAQSAAEALRAAGVKAQAVWGEMDRAARAEAINGLRNGDLDILTNCAVLTEGTDIPRAEVAIMARPTKSGVLYRQMVGRVLRPFPGKTEALILDIVGSTTDHRLCNLLDLADGEIKAKAKKKPEDEQQELLDGETLLDGVDRIERRSKVRKVSATDVNLFASTSKVVWLQTAGGIWFIPAGDGQVFVREWSMKPGMWVLGRMPRTGDPEPLGKAPDLTLAMALGEEHAARIDRAGGARFSRKNARWRDQEPKTAQLQTAERFGIQVPAGATSGEVSDMISIRVATSRIDRYFAKAASRAPRLPVRAAG